MNRPNTGDRRRIPLVVGRVTHRRVNLFFPRSHAPVFPGPWELRALIAA